jgi:hypothetical protein
MTKVEKVCFPNGAHGACPVVEFPTGGSAAELLLLEISLPGLTFREAACYTVRVNE